MKKAGLLKTNIIQYMWYGFTSVIPEYRPLSELVIL